MPHPVASPYGAMSYAGPTYPFTAPLYPANQLVPSVYNPESRSGSPYPVPANNALSAYPHQYTCCPFEPAPAPATTHLYPSTITPPMHGYHEDPRLRVGSRILQLPYTLYESASGIKLLSSLKALAKQDNEAAKADKLPKEQWIALINFLWSATDPREQAYDDWPARSKHGAPKICDARKDVGGGGISASAGKSVTEKVRLYQLAVRVGYEQYKRWLMEELKAMRHCYDEDPGEALVLIEGMEKEDGVELREWAKCWIAVEGNRDRFKKSKKLAQMLKKKLEESVMQGVYCE